MVGFGDFTNKMHQTFMLDINQLSTIPQKTEAEGVLLYLLQVMVTPGHQNKIDPVEDSKATDQNFSKHKCLYQMELNNACEKLCPQPSKLYSN